MANVLESEENNILIERALILNNGFDREVAAMMLVKKLPQFLACADGEMVASPFTADDPALMFAGRVGVEDLAPLLRGSGALSPAQQIQLGRLGSAFGEGQREQLREVITLLRSGLELEDNVYRNPFVVMHYRKFDIAHQLFGDDLKRAVCLSVRECKRLLAKWRDGGDFRTVLRQIAAGSM
jgi:hypothetical protein